MIMTPEETGTTERTAPSAEAARSAKEKSAALRKLVVQQLFFELALPLGGYYGLRAAGAGQWTALAVGSVLALPWLVYGIVKRRKVEMMPVFTLLLMVVGALMSLVTGDPRVLLVRDSWLNALIGFWVLGTLATRRPFMMTAARSVVLAKVGEEGWRAWESRWDTQPRFRHDIRLITAVWGAVLTLDAGVRVVLAYTLPLDLVPGVSTAQWLVVLAGLLAFHNRFVTRSGLKV
ncbi:VC0807 family protein [Streptomyces sp. NPDC051162]|uniref:VC0807 family protein n=1 Tax=Streptomyces sp. NPDC051162 TaxID=3154747 RepID=UPI00341A1844